MSATIEISVGLSGLGGVYAASVYPDQSDTAAISGATITESSNRKGVYTFSTGASTATGLSQILLYNSGNQLPWHQWCILAASGYVVADDDRGVLSGASVTLSNGQISSIAAGVIAGLGGAQITIVSPLNANGTMLQVVTGDSYTVANGRSLTFSITGATNLIGSVPHLRITGQSTDLATAPTITSGSQSIVFSDITAIQTSALTPSSNTPYQIRFESGSDVATPIVGNAVIVQGI